MKDAMVEQLNHIKRIIELESEISGTKFFGKFTIIAREGKAVMIDVNQTREVK